VISRKRLLQRASLLALLGAFSERASAQVVVDEVDPGWAAERGGVHAGDVLVSAGAASHRPLRTAFDVRQAEIEDAKKGPVAVDAIRDGAKIRLTLPPSTRWGVFTRPFLDPRLEAAWQEGQAALRATHSDAAFVAWRRVVAGLALKRWRERASLWTRAGQLCLDTQPSSLAHQAFAAARDEMAAHQAPLEMAIVEGWEAKAFERENDAKGMAVALRRALELTETARPRSLETVDALNRLGQALSRTGELDEARATFERALVLVREAAPESLAVVEALNGLGAVEQLRGETSAGAHWEEALHITESLAPDSLDLADGYHKLGVVALDREDLAKAEEWYGKAAALRQRLAPQSLDMARSFMNLGNVAHQRSDLPASERYARQALELFERYHDDLDAAGALVNLGNVLSDLGHYDDAESTYQRALTLYERIAPGRVRSAWVLENLGGLALNRHDVQMAEGYIRRELEILRREAPGEILDIGHSLTILSDALRSQGKLDEAQRAIEEAIDALRGGDRGLYYADALYSRGETLEARGDLDGAEREYCDSLDIFAREARPFRGAAGALSELGGLAARRGDLDLASFDFEQALATYSSVAPGAADGARALNNLGNVRRRQKRSNEALGLLRGAVEAIEAQRRNLGGSEEVRAGFAADFKHYYRDYIDLLIERGRGEEAFHGTERYRAQTFLAMLAERDLSFADDLPEDVVRDSRELATRYGKADAELWQAQHGAEDADLEPLYRLLRELADKKAEIARRVRQASPRVASLRYPEPLSVPAVAQTLDADTALVSFFVEESRTLLFVVTPGRHPVLTVVPLAVGNAALGQQVESLVRSIRLSAPMAELSEASHRMYEALLRPAEPLLLKSHRLLIIPDGPLHRLPFAALVRRMRRQGPEYLVEWKPLHQALSATVYAEIRARGPAARSREEVVAFGDPVNPDVRLAALPSSRREVEAISELYPGRSEVFVGEAATEERARRESRGGRYVHFACHSVLDERSPLNSALVLAPSKEGETDGLLHAWEILENVRLDADLVTLSGCETALGKEEAGEGIIGVTRAFLFAGARSVMASLWAVGDESTADLMRRFYTHLVAGKSKADALRAAQLEMIGADAASASGKARGIGAFVILPTAPRSHPFRWAAFQLFGDWR
jgi:CHAT domain-containing protein